ncbi:hypothetical protein GCM10027294_43770 [Marinactinospora endophytica]
MPHIRVTYPHAGRSPGDVVYVSSAEAARRERDGTARVVPSPVPDPVPTRAVTSEVGSAARSRTRERTPARTVEQKDESGE